MSLPVLKHKRYHLTASFNEEQRRGFIVTHTVDKEFDTAIELSDHAMQFLGTYNSEYCHGMKYLVEEK